jgi:hypothetical protein
VKTLKTELDEIRARIDLVTEQRSQLRARADDMIQAAKVLGSSSQSPEVVLLRNCLEEQVEAIEQEIVALRPDDLFAKRSEIRRDLDRRERAARAVASIPGAR